MWLSVRLRLNFKIKCVAAFLFLLSIFILITTKIRFYRNEIPAFLLAQDEVIYLKQDDKYYANGEAVYEENGRVTYQDCGDSNKIIALKYFDTQPKTLSIPQNISLSVVFEILQDFTKQLKIGVSISRKLPLVGYVRLPCIAGYGSCLYEEVCNIYEWCPEDSLEYSVLCPKWLKASGFECKCPFKKGIYSTKAALAHISSTLVPSWIVRGDYIALLTLEDTIITSGGNASSSRTLGCFKFMFRLT